MSLEVEAMDPGTNGERLVVPLSARWNEWPLRSGPPKLIFARGICCEVLS